MFKFIRRNKSTPLKSAVGKNIKMPFSDMALNLEYKGISVTDNDHWYWCVSPIYDEQSRVHLFAPDGRKRIKVWRCGLPKAR